MNPEKILQEFLLSLCNAGEKLISGCIKYAIFPTHFIKITFYWKKTFAIDENLKDRFTTHFLNSLLLTSNSRPKENDFSKKLKIIKGWKFIIWNMFNPLKKSSLIVGLYTVICNSWNVGFFGGLKWNKNLKINLCKSLVLY